MVGQLQEIESVRFQLKRHLWIRLDTSHFDERMRMRPNMRAELRMHGSLPLALDNHECGKWFLQRKQLGRAQREGSRRTHLRLFAANIRKETFPIVVADRTVPVSDLA